MSVITDSEETLEVDIQTQQIHANAHTYCTVCGHTPQLGLHDTYVHTLCIHTHITHARDLHPLHMKTLN